MRQEKTSTAGARTQFIRLEQGYPTYSGGEINPAYSIVGGGIVGYCKDTREWLKWNCAGELHDSFGETSEAAANLAFATKAVATAEVSEVRYIDMTPTWEGILPVLVETKHHPDSMAELVRMARLADSANTPLQKAAPAMLDTLKDLEAWIKGVVGMTVEANSLRNLFLDRARAAIKSAEGTNL